MRDQAEQEFVSSTDAEDLSAALHNFNTPLAEETEEEEEVFEDIPQEYTESYGTGVHDLSRYKDDSLQ